MVDLYEDLRDGHNLISLLEVLSGETLVSIGHDVFLTWDAGNVPKVLNFSLSCPPMQTLTQTYHTRSTLLKLRLECHPKGKFNESQLKSQSKVYPQMNLTMNVKTMATI